VLKFWAPPVISLSNRSKNQKRTGTGNEEPPNTGINIITRTLPNWYTCPSLVQTSVGCKPGYNRRFWF
jgi:hypothetical protein